MQTRSQRVKIYLEYLVSFLSTYSVDLIFQTFKNVVEEIMCMLVKLY